MRELQSKSDHKEYRAVMLETHVAEQLKKAKPKGETMSSFVKLLLSKTEDRKSL